MKFIDLNWGTILGLFGVYNIKYYGAKGNYDPLTKSGEDDTNAILKAIEAASSVSGKVFLPPGKYKINKSILIKRGVQFIGAGTKHTFIYGTLGGEYNSNKPVLIAQSETHIEGINIPKCDMGVGINFESTRTFDVTITNNFFDHLFVGVYVNQGFRSIHEDIIISHNRFERNTYAVMVDRMQNSKICFNIMNLNTRTGIQFYGGNRNLISHNRIFSGVTGINFLATKNLASSLGMIYGNIIAHNHMEKFSEEGVGFDVRGNDFVNGGAQEVDTVSSLFTNNGDYGVILSSLSWTGVGGPYAGYFMSFLTGNQKGVCWTIKSQTDGRFILEGMSAAIQGTISVGDKILIGIQAVDNQIVNNWINSPSGTASISLWGSSYGTIIQGNQCIGKISVSSLHGIGRSGSVVTPPNGDSLPAPCENNQIKDNKVSRGNIHLEMKRYGSAAPYYSIGNIVEGNIIQNGSIVSEYQDDLIRDNIIINGTLIYVAQVRPFFPKKGDSYYDKTLNKPIWYDGTNWRDSIGDIV
ncbi:glycosyl hydrolase family 28-related protein [Paenibacillus sp. EC2-1]|uniref:glycosyl hydrolase family 28-related protein n=1 Tax=Paenibacillus sp. EC2-1 TaxID=3388665 RepID=UPI003BEF3709